ncbi:Acid-sensing ion channel 2 [Desmophyllum pertusum]|uniref:Acid-sensing ion channel 2 n=1 Tax=Desmophyllum pertusum TaxID=174260 RepID=A0A9X0CX70_9CNID|nr:Acid-sensing ion channel 2 [Desmophyllum pertusum]
MAFRQQSVGIPGVEYNTNEHDPRISQDIKDDNVDHREMEGLRSFAQDTTLHGARFLFADNVCRRLLWTLATISCLTYCGYQVFTCLMQFNKRPFNTKMTTHISTDSSELLFPAVTLCNLNAFNTRRYKQLYPIAKYDNEEIIERKIKDISLMLSKSNEILSEEYKQRNPELFQRQKMAGNTNEAQGRVGHQIEEMLLPSTSQFNSCSIDGMQCSANNFTGYLTPMFGKCFTFNSAKGADNPPLQATLAGENSGLKLRLNIERESYVANPLRPFVGLAILIHDQKSFPSVEDFGIKIQPGVSTLIAIKRRKIINLKEPYATNCTDRTLDVFNSDKHSNYTKAACLMKCRNDHTIKACGCSPAKFKAKSSVPICAPNDTILCVYRSQEEFGTSAEKNKCEKDCPEPCYHTEYKTSFSYSGLQREPLIEHLMLLLNGTDEKTIGQSSDLRASIEHD